MNKVKIKKIVGSAAIAILSLFFGSEAFADLQAAAPDSYVLKSDLSFSSYSDKAAAAAGEQRKLTEKSGPDTVLFKGEARTAARQQGSTKYLIMDPSFKFCQSCTKEQRRFRSEQQELRAAALSIEELHDVENRIKKHRPKAADESFLSITD
jgi:hypothetical protein